VSHIRPTLIVPHVGHCSSCLPGSCYCLNYQRFLLCIKSCTVPVQLLWSSCSSDNSHSIQLAPSAPLYSIFCDPQLSDSYEPGSAQELIIADSDRRASIPCTTPINTHHITDLSPAAYLQSSCCFVLNILHDVNQVRGHTLQAI
jgi:hypothetical protein